MKDAIRCAANFEEIRSPNFSHFIDEYGVHTDYDQLSGVSYIPLHFLREVYLNDKALFFRLVKEFGLRGYQVITSNHSLFYNNIVPFDKLDGKIRSLQANLSGERSWRSLVLPPSIQTFLSDSHIDSNQFFDGLIVDNLFKVFPETDESLLTALSNIGVVISEGENSYKFKEETHLSSSTVEEKCVRISDLFDPNHHHMIINAFKNNGIETTDDITSEKLRVVFKTKGMGKKKIAFVQETLQANYLLKTAEPQENETKHIKIFPEIILHSFQIRKVFADNAQVELKCTENGQINDFDLAFLHLVKTSKKYKELKERIERDINSYLKWTNGHSEPSLDANHVREIVPKLGLSNNLLNAIDHFHDEQHQEFLEELSYEFSISLDKRVDAVQSELIERISQKKNWVAIEDIMKIHPKSTLQEIGDKIGITRERVRQIKVNICSLKCDLAKDYRIEQFLCWSCFKSNQPLIFIDELDNRLIGLLQDIKSQLIIQPKNKHQTPFIILNQEKETLREVNNWVNKFQNENELNINSLWELFKKFIGVRPEQALRKQLLNKILKTYQYNYVFPGHAYKKLTKARVIYHIYFNKFGNDFSISDLPLLTLNQEYKSITGNNLFESGLKRNPEDLVNNMLLRVAADTPGILYVGGGRYEDDPSEKINDCFFAKVKLFTQESLQKFESIKINKIYSHFQSYLTQVGVDSPTELYFVLKKHLSKFFSFAEGNELNIWSLNADKISNEEILSHLLENNGNRMAESDITEKLGWTRTSIEQTAIASSNLSYGKGEVYYQHLSIPAKIREFVSREISVQAKAHPHYVLVRPIQQKLKNDWELLAEIPHTEILTNLDMFANLIKAIDNDWKGYSQALYKNDQIDVSTILHDHFKDESFDKDQYVSFFSDLGYSPVTINSKLNKLIFDNTIAKVGPDRLMFTELLNISHEEQLQIDKYLLNMFDSTTRYISLKREIVNGTILPKIFNLTWTRELLFYFASKSESVKPLRWPQGTNTTSFPINPMIIVKRDDSINSLLDLVKYCMENFTGNRAVMSVKNYLKNKDILIGKTNNGTLPEILSPIFSVDDDNVVHLKKQEAKR